MKFTITQLSKMFNNTKGALRFYEEKQLINPCRENNNRIYTLTDIYQLVYLKRYQSIGYTMKNTFDLFNSSNTNSLDDLNQSLLDTENDILSSIELQNLKLKWLQNYQQCITTIQKEDGSLKPLNLNGMYYVDAQFFEHLDHIKIKFLQHWLNAQPFITVFAEYNAKNLNNKICNFYLGIDTCYVKALNLELGSFVKHKGACKGYSCIIKAFGNDFETDLTNRISDYLKDIEFEEMAIYATLVYSHVIDGVKTKYYQIYFINKTSTNT